MSLSQDLSRLPDIQFAKPPAECLDNTKLPYDDPNDDIKSLEKYFDITKFNGFEEASEPMIVELDKIYSEDDKTRTDGVLRGAYNMKESYNLNSSDYNTDKDIRREPILVENYNEKKDKIYRILDGHSTYENARKAQWPKIYVVRIENEKVVKKAKQFLNNKKELRGTKSSEPKLRKTELHDYEAPLLDPDNKLVGGYHRYKYKSRRYKRNKHYSKKNHTKKNHTKKNKHYSKKNHTKKKYTQKYR
jgi:hypothetical protein